MKWLIIKTQVIQFSEKEQVFAHCIRKRTLVQSAFTYETKLKVTRHSNHHIT